MSILYVTKEGLAGFRRAKLSALGSIVTITIALLMVGLFYVLSSNTARIVRDLREKLEMDVFIEEPVSRKRLKEIEERLTTQAGVERVQFISKEDAAKIFKEEFGEDINKVLDFNPLPPSFKVFLREDYRTSDSALGVTSQIKEIKGVDDVVYRKDLLQFLDQRTRVLYRVGLIVGILITVSSIFLVSNTIRLTILAQRKTV